MFIPTKPAEKFGKRDPPKKERKAIKLFIQNCQKPFFNPRIAKFTGAVIYIQHIFTHYFPGKSESEYKERVLVLAGTIRQFVYGNDNNDLRYFYHKENDVSDETPIQIQHRSLEGKDVCSVSYSVCSV
jgi:hypothetical protein